MSYIQGICREIGAVATPARTGRANVSDPPTGVALEPFTGSAPHMSHLVYILRSRGPNGLPDDRTSGLQRG